jgi:type IV fimbrial biogenesis protein FimT
MNAMMFMNFRRSRMARGRERGFTLVELIIVMVIMAIVAAIAAPNLKNFTAKRRLNGAARLVMSDLMNARMQAVSQNNKFKITVTSNHEYSILDDDDSDESSDSGEILTTRDIQTEYPDVTLSATANPVFYTRGTANGATITVSNSAGSKTVSLAITGRVVIGS